MPSLENPHNREQKGLTKDVQRDVELVRDRLANVTGNDVVELGAALGGGHAAGGEVGGVWGGSEDDDIAGSLLFLGEGEGEERGDDEGRRGKEHRRGREATARDRNDGRCEEKGEAGREGDLSSWSGIGKEARFWSKKGGREDGEG